MHQQSAAQPQQQAQPGQAVADYSAQWAEYYRSLGMHEQAQMVSKFSSRHTSSLTLSDRATDEAEAGWWRQPGRSSRTGSCAAASVLQPLIYSQTALFSIDLPLILNDVHPFTIVFCSDFIHSLQFGNFTFPLDCC